MEDVMVKDRASAGVSTLCSSVFFFISCFSFQNFNEYGFIGSYNIIIHFVQFVIFSKIEGDQKERYEAFD